MNKRIKKQEELPIEESLLGVLFANALLKKHMEKENKEESQMLRSAMAKIGEGKEAELTPEEKKCKEKYDNISAEPFFKEA